MLDGGDGSDWLEGGAGADVLRGGEGEDTARYRYSGAGVEVNLATRTARGGDAEGDTYPGLQTIGYTDPDGTARETDIADIENVFGSVHDDILIGNRTGNTLMGITAMTHWTDGKDRIICSAAPGRTFS